MNGWRPRLTVIALILALMWAHSYATANLPNTPLGMLLFHGTGALADFALLLAIPYWLTGKLCDDSETLLLIVICINAIGWGLYMAYAPPIWYNGCMWGASIAQWLRLLYVDRHDADSVGLDLVRRGHHHGRQLYFTKASK